MWRWPVVQARKEAVNIVKWKIFATHAKLISLAAQKWWDMDKNPALFAAVHTAKKAWVPNENIDRAIKKWTWEDKDALRINEIVYEWYALGWVSVMVSTLTDNKNRTVASVRHIFTKFGGNMWELWVVSWMFHRKWVIFIDPKIHSLESIEDLIYETSAEDIISEDDYIKIITQSDNLHDTVIFLEAKNISIMESKIDFIPDNETEIIEFDKALKFTKMLEAFDNDEDINFISTNEIIAPELQKQVDEFIEKNIFRT